MYLRTAVNYETLLAINFSDVSNQRELLMDFAEYIQRYKNKGLEFDGVIREVDAYLKSIK